MTGLRSRNEADYLASQRTNRARRPHLYLGARTKPPLPRERFSPLAEGGPPGPPSSRAWQSKTALRNNHLDHVSNCVQFEHCNFLIRSSVTPVHVRMVWVRA